MKRKPSRKKKALFLVGVLAAAFVVYVLVLPLKPGATGFSPLCPAF